MTSHVRILATVAAAAAIGIGFAPAVAQQSTPLQHLVFVVEENRSFDEYFGTYPGADGLPYPAVCQRSNWYPSDCFTPFPDHLASNQGGPYSYKYQTQDVDGGAMDNFVVSREQELGPKCAPGSTLRGAEARTAPAGDVDDEGIHYTKKCIVDVMGYHTQSDIPNYWAYAQNYVLFDHFYESVKSYSLTSHLALFSGWSAICKHTNPPQIDSCGSSTGGKIWGEQPNEPAGPMPYLWTDITYLLFQNNVSWGVYLDNGLDPFTRPFALGGVQLIWDVLPGFETVQQDYQVANSELSLQQQFYYQAAAGTLPAVSWILPAYKDSDHPQASIAQSQSYVTNLVNAVENGPDWSSTAIVILWDDMGGFYDHEPPPFALDANGPGLRVPAILISPYALAGVVDHQILTSDSLLALIEDVFLNGEGIAQSGRPDPRPDYRDQSPELGSLLADFNFSQPPRKPLLLPVHPKTTLIANPQDDTAFDPDAPGPRIR